MRPLSFYRHISGLALRLLCIVATTAVAQTPAAEAQTPAAAPPAAAAAPPSSTTPAPLTFDAALAMALAQSLEAQRAALAAELAAEDAAIVGYENDAHVVPSATVSDAAARQRELVATPQSRGAVLALTITKPLYDFGRHRAHLDAADVQTAVKVLAKDEVTDTLRYQVARAYAVVIATERTISIVAEQVAVTEAKLRDVTVYYRNGLRPESDVVAAEVDLGRTRLALATARDDARSARIVLGLLLGAPAPALAGEVPAALLAEPAPEALAALVAGWQEFGRSAAQARRAKEVEATAADEEQVRSDTRPLLSASLAAQAGRTWGGGYGELYSGQLELSWDLPWNGRLRDEVRRIGLRRQDLGLVEQADLKSRRDKDAAAQDHFRAAESQYRAGAAQVQLTARQRRLVQRRYDAGKATALEVSTAENDLLNAKLEQVRLLNTMAAAMVDIAEARVITAVGRIFQ